MKQYFILKSGFDFYDLCRAYGLGLILNRLKNSKEEVKVKDLGFYYQIESPPINLKKKKEVIGLIPNEISKLSKTNIGPRWDQVLRTCKIPGDSTKKKKLKEYKEILNKNINRILERHTNIQSFEKKNLNTKKDVLETLYGTIDPACFKGFREIKRNLKYDEGSSYKSNCEEIVLALIGAAYLGIWVLGKEGGIAIFGKPGVKGVFVNSLINIKKNISDQIKFHRGGVSPTIVWTSLCLMAEIEKFKDELLFPLFEELYFNVLKWTGNQPKPEKGGKFSLDFLNKLLKEMTRTDFLDLMDIWKKLLKISNNAGLEQLGRTLSEFLANPTITNFEHYIKTHLHFNLNKKVGIVYNQNLMKEISKYVSAT